MWESLVAAIISGNTEQVKSIMYDNHITCSLFSGSLLLKKIIET